MSDGFIILDKPNGLTSRQVGGRIARMFGQKKFGHIGTLDPMASGLLVIALGEATKIIPFLEPRLSVKEYDFGITWGIETDTGDITGTIINGATEKVPEIDEIRRVLPGFIGKQLQIPPAFSAKKIDGVPAYALARKGLDVDLKPSEITIYDLKVFDDLVYRVKCSSGTYVRSIARDIADKLGLIATCDMIRRIAVGNISIKNAASLDFLENLYNNDRAELDRCLAPLDFGLDDIPVAKLETDAALFANGGFISGQKTEGLVRVYSDDKFIGIGAIENGILKPKRILKCR